MQYDAVGRRTRLTWSDGFYVTYEYDAQNEMTAIRENGGSLVASFAYDDLGRRTSLTRGNGTTTTYGYDPASRLNALSHDLAGTAHDLALTFGYNPASQINTRTASNDAYAFTLNYNVDRPYTVNGLNQYTAVNSVVPTYDGKGNLRSAGSTVYEYSTLNQLVTTSAPAKRLIYGPGGLLNSIQDPPGGGGADNGFQRLDGQIVDEIAGTAGFPIQRRYVFGPNGDEPLVWYEGAGTTDRRYLVADERGSVVAVTNSAGNATAINAYDEYGIPGGNYTIATNGRFQYTGQAWVPELGMYDYKARMYSPTLGRFMQTDPIGYGDGLNWYNYVGSDPVNATDPSGLATTIYIPQNACNERFFPYSGKTATDGNNIFVSGGSYNVVCQTTLIPQVVPDVNSVPNPMNGSGNRPPPQNEEQPKDIVVNGRRLPHPRFADPRWPAAMQPNGCTGVPDLFPQACSVHDICYVTVGVARDVCDRQFYFNMMVERPDRKGYALDYYIGVINVGGRFYRDGQRLGREYLRSNGR